MLIGPEQNPVPLPYLVDPQYDSSAFDVNLEVTPWNHLLYITVEEREPSALLLSAMRHTYSVASLLQPPMSNHPCTVLHSAVSHCDR